MENLLSNVWICSYAVITILLFELTLSEGTSQFILPGRIPQILLANCAGEMHIKGMRNMMIVSNLEGFYPPNRDCILYISVTPGYFINITLHHFDLAEPHPNGECTDSVQFFNGLGNELQLSEPLCGEILPKTIISNRSQATLKFRTDGNGERTGFRVAYDRLDPSILKTTSFLTKGSRSWQEDNKQFDQQAEDLLLDQLEIRREEDAKQANGARRDAGSSSMMLQLTLLGFFFSCLQGWV